VWIVRVSPALSEKVPYMPLVCCPVAPQPVSSPASAAMLASAALRRAKPLRILAMLSTFGSRARLIAHRRADENPFRGRRMGGQGGAATEERMDPDDKYLGLRRRELTGAQARLGRAERQRDTLAEQNSELRRLLRAHGIELPRRFLPRRSSGAK